MEQQAQAITPASWHIDTLQVDPNLLGRLLKATKMRNEIGGLLLGDRDSEHRSARVLGFAFPRQKRVNTGYCEFDMRWVSLARGALLDCDLHPDITILAWIHTHPKLSVFLSGTDVSTIDSLQTYNPLTLAVVLDPFTVDMGAFHHDRYQRDTRIEYAPISLNAALEEKLQALAATPQLSLFYKRSFVSRKRQTRPYRPSEIDETTPDFTQMMESPAAANDAADSQGAD